MANEFVGFTQDSFDFFRELGENNHTTWFKANRERYDTHVVGAFRGMLQALEPFLLKLNPHFETAGKTNRNFSRINRDIRFSKDKSPYKSNYYLYVFDARQNRSDGGRLYLGLTADCVTVGFSIYGGSNSSRGRGKKDKPADALSAIFRKRMLSHRNVFDRLLHDIVRKARYETYWHREEKKGWGQHRGLPRVDADWQTMQAWIVRKVVLPGGRGVQTPLFARQVERIFADLYPLYVFSSVAGPGWQRKLKMRT
jgi:uncharacterized protein (TIGR02453 family)